jgi:DNA-binding NtrC family response regulator
VNLLVIDDEVSLRRTLRLTLESMKHQVAEASSGQPALAARDVVREEGWRWQIGIDEPLEELLGTEGLRSLGAVFAVDRDGVLRGVVTIDQVRRALTPAR